MNQNWLYVLLFLISFTESKIPSFNLTNTIPKDKEKYHPFKMRFDFSKMKQSKNIGLVEKLDGMLSQVSKVFSQIFNIKNSKLIQTDLSPEHFCDKNIDLFDNQIKKGIKADLLIYPFFVSNQTKKVSSNLCVNDLVTKRPIIAKMMFNENINFTKTEEMDNLFIQITHQIIHILGFNRNVFRSLRLLLNSRLVFYSLKNINEKTYGKWLSTFLEKSHIKINYDIMNVNRNNRMLFFSAQTLIILQRLNWYQINLSLCGCSLNGNCEYLKHPIGIYISKYSNNERNAHCFLNGNLNQKCSLLNDTYIPNSILLKVNENKYSNYFDGNHCINRFLTLEPSLPKISNEQVIHLLYPKENGKCKNKQRTIFFYYPDYLAVTNRDLKGYKIEPYTIKNKNMTIYFSYIPTSMVDYPPVVKTLKYNKIPEHSNFLNPNFISHFFTVQKLAEIYGTFGKYSVINTLINIKKLLDNKDNLYLNFRKKAKEFPNDFQFVPESYVKSKDLNIMKKKFKNYKQKENDLWIYKPPLGLQGVGIKFMKSEKDFLKYSFISKYISNPHLLYGKKYHIRMYVVITGILPLKIYIFDEGQVMRPANNYSYDLSKIENKTASFTNGHLNFHKPGYNPNATLDTEEGSEWSIKTLSRFIERNNGNWTEVWNKIKDISVKTILMAFDESQRTMLEDFPNLRRNNIVHRFGFDIMIDDNLKPWLLEVNAVPGMALYNIINVNNKIRLETDYLNLIGMVPFDHFTQEPLDKEINFKNKVDELIQLSICEFERPHGGLERIFPVKKTLNYYKQFIKYHDEYNKALWEFIENNEDEI